MPSQEPIVREAARESRPQKIGQVIYTIWDDGALSEEYLSIVKPERGSVQKWRLERREFKRDIEAQVGDALHGAAALLKSVAEGR